AVGPGPGRGLARRCSRETSLQGHTGASCTAPWSSDTIGALDTALMLRVSIAGLASAMGGTTAAAAAKAPALPQATGHRTVTVVARGVPTPTEFAAFSGRLFVAGYGDEHNPKVAGGVYVLGGGKAIRVPGSPQHVWGVAAAKNALYLSTSQALIAWSGW